jgi:hypothetical protein
MFNGDNFADFNTLGVDRYPLFGYRYAPAGVPSGGLSLNVGV